MEDNTIVEDVNTSEETKKVKTPKEKVIFGLKIAGNVVFYAIILALLLFSIMNINAGSKNGGFPNIFGKGFLSVQSNSMTRDGKLPKEYDDYKVGAFAQGDLLYADVIKDANDFYSLKVGDVVTFYDEGIKNLNSHRIVHIYYDSDNKVETISVQGDYSASIFGVFNPEDSEKTDANYNLISRGDVVSFSINDFSNLKGKITGVNYGAGALVDNIKQNWGWFFVLPIAIVLLVELFFVIKNIVALTGEKQRAAIADDKEKMMADLEAQKEAMRAQILAELKAQEEANNKETTDKVEESDKKEE